MGSSRQSKKYGQQATPWWPVQIVDLGQLWIRQRLQGAMQVETDVLAALDNSLRILMKHIPFLADQDHQPHPRSMVRKLCRWLLAVRHNYLDAVVYSKAAEIESRAMEQVQILVVSASNLNKIAAGQSPWSDWFAKHKLGVLCVDELPGQAFEEVVALSIGFPYVVLCGDRNQFLTEQRQNPVVARMSMEFTNKKGPQFDYKGPQPLNRHNAADWVQNLSQKAPENAVSESSYVQYRYGGDTIKFMQHTFLDKFAQLSCPTLLRNTLILPYFFKPIKFGPDRWSYSESSEVSRSPTIFTHFLAIVATHF